MDIIKAVPYIRILRTLYREELQEDYTEHLTGVYLSTISYDSEFLEIKDGNLRVKKGYKWNYCSPQFYKVLFKWGGISKVFQIGAWNGFKDKKTGKVQAWACSLVHDVLYEYPECGISKKTADNIFYRMGKRDGFMVVGVYYKLLGLFGWFFYDNWYGRIKFCVEHKEFVGAVLDITRLKLRGKILDFVSKLMYKK